MSNKGYLTKIIYAALVISFIGILSIFIIQVSEAEESIPSLTIDQAVELALRENRNLMAARIQVEEARGRLVQAGLFPNPELESEFGFDSFFANEGERNFSAGISQPIPLSGRIGAQKRVAHVDIKRTFAGLANLERILVRDVRVTFIELLTIEEQLKLQETLISLNSELIKGIEIGIKEGLASKQDFNAVAIALQQARQEKEVLIAQRRSKVLQINKLLGKPPTLSFLPQGKLEYEAAQVVGDYNVEMALAQRPDLKFTKLNIELARADLKLAKALRFEDLTAGIFYENDRLILGTSQEEITDSDQLIGFRLTIPLPFFDRKQGLIAEVRARERRAEERVRALELTISQEVSDALNRVSSLSALLETYKSGILKIAEDNVTLVETGFKQGLVGIVDVIQSRQQFAALTSSYINAVRDYEIAINDLQIAAGSYPSTIKLDKTNKDDNR
ncbi:MAG: TolC family protein [Thermodesulfobacteriota bacterium]